MIKSGDKDLRESRLWFIEMYKVSRMGLFINQSMVTLQGGGYTASRICLESASTIVESRMYNQIPLSPAQILGDAVLCSCDTLPGYYIVTNNTKWYMKNISNFDNYGFDPAKVVKVDESYLNMYPLAYYFW